MDLQIIDYDKKYDDKLLHLFYKSVFHNREMFEYSRPSSWIQRYLPYKSPIIKIAKYKNTIIGSLGILPGEAVINGDVIDGGYFVDNSILPEYIEEHDTIMQKLFLSVEKEAIKNKYKFIAGWDYLEKFEQHKDLYSDIGFIAKKGANWFAGGLEYRSDSPQKWRASNRLYWSSILVFLKFYNSFKKVITPKNLNGIKIRLLEINDFTDVVKFINQYHPSEGFHSNYSKEELLHLWNSIGLRGLIAEKNGDIISVLTFVISTWTGLMYGYPYKTDWEEYQSITPDEFIMLPSWTESKLPIVMIRSLYDLEKRYNFPSRTHGVITTIFDRNIEWMKKSFKKMGCLEVKEDFGVFLIKNFDKKEITYDKNWSIPARLIIAPNPNWFKD